MLKEKIGQRIKEIRMFNLKVSQDELATILIFMFGI